MRFPDPRLFLAPILLPASCVLEFLVMFGLNPPGFPWIPPVEDHGSRLVMHLVSGVLAALAFPGWNPFATAERGATTRLAPTIFVLTVLVPVFGHVTALVLGVATWLALRRDTHAIDDYRHLVDFRVPVAGVPEDALERDVERSRYAMNVAPFSEVVDTFSNDGTALGSVFRSLAFLERPVACRLLRQGLKSRVATTRYYSSTILARMEEELDRNLHEYLNDVETSPDDPRAMERLADSRFSYVEMNGPDDPVSSFHLSESLNLFRRALEATPGEDEDTVVRIRTRLAHALLVAGEVDEARSHFIDLVDRGVESASTLLGCLEACYRSGDPRLLDHYLEKISKLPIGEGVLAGTLQTWRRTGIPPRHALLGEV